MSSAGALDGTPPPPVPHISRLPLLADAMLLRNPELRSLPGLQVAVLGVTDDTRAHARCVLACGWVCLLAFMR